MVPCAYCERPLTCDRCRAEYTPPSMEHYQALSRAEDLVACPECGQVLICHWCKTPYDGTSEESQETSSPRA
jgi:hypothetical protein